MDLDEYFKRIARWLEVEDTPPDYGNRDDKDVRAEVLQQCRSMTREQVVALAAAHRYLGDPTWHACQQNLDETNTEMRP